MKKKVISFGSLSKNGRIYSNHSSYSIPSEVDLYLVTCNMVGDPTMPDTIPPNIKPNKKIKTFVESDGIYIEVDNEGKYEAFGTGVMDGVNVIGYTLVGICGSISDSREYVLDKLLS